MRPDAQGAKTMARAALPLRGIRSLVYERRGVTTAHVVRRLARRPHQGQLSNLPHDYTTCPVQSQRQADLNRAADVPLPN